MNQGIAVRVENLHKVHRTGTALVHVLRGIDLTVAQGEHLVITGVSGAGKSTFLHILGGLEHPSEGQVFLDHHNLYGLSEQERARLRRERIGFVFQFHHLLEDFSALENVMIPLLALNEKSSRARRRAGEILELMGLKERLHHRPQELSGGEQQRVAIARALVHEPALLLMDEPTGNLDHETAGGIHDLLFELAGQYRFTWITVTHNPAFARRFPRQLLMERGELRPG